MEGKVLLNGIIIASSIEKVRMQDYIEVKLEDGQVVIITASVSGRLKIGLKIGADVQIG